MSALAGEDELNGGSSADTLDGGTGSDVLIGDPWRAFLPRSRLQLIAEYPVLEFGEAGNAAAKPSAVFSLKPNIV